MDCVIPVITWQCIMYNPVVGGGKLALPLEWRFAWLWWYSSLLLLCSVAFGGGKRGMKSGEGERDGEGGGRGDPKRGIHKI